MSDGVHIMETYIKLLDTLIGVRIGDDNRKLYVETMAGKLYNFRASDFRLGLKKHLAGEVKPDEFLRILKTLQLIVSENERFTCVQKINNKARRVISVDMEKYRLIKSLTWRGDELVAPTSKMQRL